MKFVLALVLVGLAAPSVYAQREGGRPGDGHGDGRGDNRGGGGNELSDKAERLAWRLRRDAYRLTDIERRSVVSHFDSIEEILRGGGGRPQAELVCVPRDNDGRYPYVLAFRADPVTVTKAMNAVYNTTADCETAAREQLSINYDESLVCVTRDRDGRYPYSLAVLNMRDQSIRQIELLTGNTLTECVTRMRQGHDYGAAGIAFCGSRDNDGRYPYIARMLRRDGTISAGEQTFATYDACVRSLN